MVNQGVLMEVFEVTSADLAFNRSGRLSDRQHVVERQRASTTLKLGLTVVVVFAIIFGVALALISERILESVLGAVVVGTVFAVLIVWNYTRSIAALRDDRVESVRGEIRLEKKVSRRAAASTTSRRQSVTYLLHADNETFMISGMRYKKLDEISAEGQTLTIYYQPRTRHIIAAEV